MVECGKCWEWFHVHCVHVPSEAMEKSNVDWFYCLCVLTNFFVLVHAYFFTSYLYNGYFDSVVGGPNISVGNKFFILFLKNKFRGVHIYRKIGSGGNKFLGEQICRAVSCLAT